MSTVGSTNVVDVVLKVSPVELDDATVLNEKIAAQAEEIEALKAQLADTQDRVTVIEETPATDTSALEARVADTEEALAAIEEGIANA